MTTARIVRGAKAIELAETTGAQLRKHADPTEGARDLTIEEDPSLVYKVLE